VLRCVICVQASQSLDLTGSRWQSMEDQEVQLVPHVVIAAALDDLSKEEVIHSKNFCR
jgi:hypothetical protein